MARVFKCFTYVRTYDTYIIHTTNSRRERERERLAVLLAVLAVLHFALDLFFFFFYYRMIGKGYCLYVCMDGWMNRMFMFCRPVPSPWHGMNEFKRGCLGIEVGDEKGCVCVLYSYAEGTELDFVLVSHSAFRSSIYLLSRCMMCHISTPVGESIRWLGLAYILPCMNYMVRYLDWEGEGRWDVRGWNWNRASAHTRMQSVGVGDGTLGLSEKGEGGNTVGGEREKRGGGGWVMARVGIFLWIMLGDV